MNVRTRIKLFITLWRVRFARYVETGEIRRAPGQWIRAFTLYAIFVTALALDHALGNNRHLTIRFDPFITPTILLTTLIGTGLSIGVNYALSIISRPRPQPVIRGKLSGDISIADSVLGAPQVRIYGGRPLGEADGGVEAGPNIFWASEIRRITTTSPGSGGKGSHQPAGQTTTLTYKIDFAGGIGPGKLRLLKFKANEDVLYNLLGSGGGVDPPTYQDYEAEASGNTLAGGAEIVVDADCSGAKKVTGIGNGGTLTYNDLDVARFRQLTIFYKSVDDVTCYVKIDGVGGLYTFPATETGLVGTKYMVRNFPGATPTHTIEFSNPDGDGPEIDVLRISDPVEINTPPGPTGTHDPHYPNELEQDNILLPDPFVEDISPIERYNLKPVEDTDDGTLSVTLSNGAEMTFYEGNDHQPIDAVIAADISQKYGAGYCPAFLDLSFIRLYNFDFSKWGVFPLVRLVVENKETQKVSEILLVEASLVGLGPEDFDLSVAEDAHSRGYYVASAQAPEKVFEDLGRLFNLSFVESVDGQIVAIDLADRTPVATLTNDHLGAYVADGGEKPPQDFVITTIPAETEMVRELEVEFHNPAHPLDLQTDKRADLNPFTTSKRKETLSFPATLTGDEALAVARRLLQTEWLKAMAYKFNLTHEFAWINAGQCVELPIGGEQKLVRIEEKTGSVPGIFECTASDDELYVVAGVPATPATLTSRGVRVAANSVATFMSIPRLEDSQNKPGIYAAAAPKDLTNGAVWSSAMGWRLKGGNWQHMATFTAPCTMGRIVAFDDHGDEFTPEAWDDKSTWTVDFFGELTPTSVTDEQGEAGANVFCFGNEIAVIATWTRDNDYPNRWVGEHMRRRQRETSGSGHVLYERCVLLNSAVRFIALDEDEQDIEREWRVQTTGQHPQVLEHCAPIMVTWTGETVIKAPVYDTIDADVPVVSYPPVITRIDQPGAGEWGIYIQRPDDYGFSIDNVEIRFRDAGDSSVVRQHKIGPVTFTRQPMFNFDCLVDYRWRNLHHTGGSDGWSSWSPTATAYGMAKTGVQQNVPDSEQTSFDNDPSDSRNPSTRKTEY